MPRTHLVPVGTSLLRNAARDLDLGRAPNDADLDNYLADAPPSAVSAENNALNRELQPGDRVVLFASDTDDGARCAQALARHLQRTGTEALPCRKRDGVEEESFRVPDLRIDERGRFLRRGLRTYVRLLIQWIKEEQNGGREVLVNATGGFKSQTSLAVLAGTILRLPVYYIFETGTENVLLPRLPLAWDGAFRQAYDDALTWATEPRERAEVERHVVGRPFQDLFFNLLDDEPDGRLRLSAVGYLVAEAEPPQEEAPPNAVEQVRHLLRGRTLAVIGGEARPEHVQNLEAAFHAPVHWEATRSHQPTAGFEPLVARVDVGIVLHLIKWTSHDVGPALRGFCDRHGKPFVSLPGGYNANQVARQILEQVGERLRKQS